MQERKRLDVTVVYLHQAFISFVVLYKRGFVMFGVVSLTMGNSPFPFGDGLPGHIQRLRQLRLGHLVLPAQGGELFFQPHCNTLLYQVNRFWLANAQPAVSFARFRRFLFRDSFIVPYAPELGKGMKKPPSLQGAGAGRPSIPSGLLGRFSEINEQWLHTGQYLPYGNHIPPG